MSTEIKFNIPKKTKVNLEIFDFMGKKVATLVEGESYDAGNYSVVWDGLDLNGEVASDGVYFYKLSTSEFTKSLNMVLIK